MEVLKGKTNEFNHYANLSEAGEASMEKQIMSEFVNRELKKYGLSRQAEAEAWKKLRLFISIIYLMNPLCMSSPIQNPILPYRKSYRNFISAAKIFYANNFAGKQGENTKLP